MIWRQIWNLLCSFIANSEPLYNLAFAQFFRILHLPSCTQSSIFHRPVRWQALCPTIPPSAAFCLYLSQSDIAYGIFSKHLYVGNFQIWIRSPCLAHESQIYIATSQGSLTNNIKLNSLFVLELLTVPECVLFYNRRLRVILFYSFFSICTVINILNNVIHCIVSLNFNLLFSFFVLLHRPRILIS